MLYLFRLLLLLINIDQETVLNWFGLEDPTMTEVGQKVENNSDVDFSNISNLEIEPKPAISNIEPASNVSLDTFRLIVKGLLDKIQDGLTLADIENILFFILFVRFIILAIRYNLKTSLYITGIGLFAGYLWYRHLIDLISVYQSILTRLPLVNNLGSTLLSSDVTSVTNDAGVPDNFKSGTNLHWYNPGQVAYSAVTNGIINVNQETNGKYYIDPISMAISNLQEPTNPNILPIYYKIYNKILPKIAEICGKFWTQLSGVAAYAVITRIGKRYCPYLVRWHWTFLLIIGMIEQLFIYFTYRVYYFQVFVLVPRSFVNPDDASLLFKINGLNFTLTSIILAHIGLILFGLFHAICGQYFYLPFFVENTELHIGRRPKNSIYSGGFTSWQDVEEKEKKFKRFFPKVWYGWFGRGTQNTSQINDKFKKFINKILKKIKKQFRI